MAGPQDRRENEPGEVWEKRLDLILYRSDFNLTEWEATLAEV